MKLSKPPFSFNFKAPAFPSSLPKSNSGSSTTSITIGSIPSIDPIQKSPIPVITASNISPYDALKKNAEELLKNQASSKAEIEILQNRLQAREKEIESQSKAILELTEARAKLELVLEQEKLSFERLNFDLVATQALCYKIKEEITNVHSRVEQGNAERAEISQRIASSSGELARLHQQAEAMSQRESDLNDELQSLKQTQSRDVSEIARLKTLLDQSQGKIDAISRERGLMKTELDLKDRSLHELNQMFERLQQQESSSRSEIEALQRRLRESESNAKESVSLLSNARTENISLGKASESLRIKIVELEGSLSIASNRAESSEREFKSRIAELESINQGREEKLAIIEKEFSSIAEELKEARIALTEEQEKVQSLTPRLDEQAALQSMVTDLRSTIEDWERKSTDDSRSISELELRVSEKQNSLDITIASLNSLTNKLSIAEAERSDVSSRCEAIQREFDEARIAHEEILRSKMEDLRSALSSREAAVFELQRTREGLESELRRQEASLKEGYQSELRRLKEINDAETKKNNQESRALRESAQAELQRQKEQHEAEIRLQKEQILGLQEAMDTMCKNHQVDIARLLKQKEDDVCSMSQRYESMMKNGIIRSANNNAAAATTTNSTSSSPAEGPIESEAQTQPIITTTTGGKKPRGTKRKSKSSTGTGDGDSQCESEKESIVSSEDTKVGVDQFDFHSPVSKVAPSKSSSSSSSIRAMASQRSTKPRTSMTSAVAGLVTPTTSLARRGRSKSSVDD